MKNIINGSRVILRKMELTDANYVVQWRNDEEILKWMMKKQKITLESHLKWFKLKKPDRIDYMICDKTNMKPIGTINFTNIIKGVAEAGKMLGDKSYWGGGFAKEAFSLWIDFGFNNLKLEKIYIQTRKDNIGNIKLNQKLGFIENRELNIEESSEEINTFIEMYITKNEFYNESE